jgi:hypothetical protein
MPSIYEWMFGWEFDRALRITHRRTGYWTPTATDDLLSLPGVTGFLGLRPFSERELEILWVAPGDGAIKLVTAEKGNWSQMSASVLLNRHPIFRVQRHYILRIPYETREGRLFLQLDRWKAVPSTPEGHTTAEKPRPRRRKR